MGKSKFLLGGVYIPPKSNLQIYYNHVESVFELFNTHPDHEFLVFGDYNIPQENSLEASCPDSSPGKVVNDSLSTIGLNQVNCIPNNHGVCLDLVFSHLITVVALAKELLMDVNYHHNAYSFEIAVVNAEESLKFENYYYDFKNMNSARMNDFLASANWDYLYGLNDINVATQFFYDVLYNSIELFVPMKRFKTSTYPVWFSHDLKSLMFRKKLQMMNTLILNFPKFALNAKS
ncbi:hypothetical protein JTB14_030156 [Gonioctena quinquepunctata]|nr:hypothetical protein JTB14_030156 [Gonioctena quinquepunctata]